MLPRSILSGLIVAVGVLGATGRSTAEAPAPRPMEARAAVPREVIKTGVVALSHPSDPAFYTFTGRPVIRAWASVPRRT